MIRRKKGGGGNRGTNLYYPQEKGKRFQEAS